MENKFWYAVLRDEGDNDWGTGSFDFDEAVATARQWGYEIILKIDGGYDAAGRATTDPIAVDEYRAGVDF